MEPRAKRAKCSVPSWSRRAQRPAQGDRLCRSDSDSVMVRLSHTHTHTHTHSPGRQHVERRPYHFSIHQRCRYHISCSSAYAAHRMPNEGAFPPSSPSPLPLPPPPPYPSLLPSKIGSPVPTVRVCEGVNCESPLLNGRRDDWRNDSHWTHT